MPSLDVIIPTWNSAHMLERTIGPLIANLRPEGIIVVDRESTDRTADIARGHGAKVLTDTVSLGSARMKGIAHSRSEWIAFIDDDIILPEGFREAMEAHIAPDIGAVQAGAISVHEPYRSVHLEEFGSRMGGEDHFFYAPGDRGFTNATLVRREILDGLDLEHVDTWEDWVITQRVLTSGYRWKVVRPFVEHIHERKELAEKEGWNAAGIINLARTGHMPMAKAMGQYVRKVLLASKGAIKYTVILRSPSNFFEYSKFILSILAAPRRVLREIPRSPKLLAPSRGFDELENAPKPFVLYDGADGREGQGPGTSP